tara:strand:- start:13 stop:600 length:588 start_codon:yes stop_codon:yes gene_type:complete
MNKILNVTGTACPILENDIDTDQIIPARFLKEITFKNMGNYAFYDARLTKTNQKTNHPMNNPTYQNASILITGKNFGCGSSREHAPQALKRFGFNAIIAESFAEIFAGNCKAIGLPLITTTKQTITDITNQIKTNPNTKITINIKDESIMVNDKPYTGNIEKTQKIAFLNGTWNAIGLLKANANKINELESNLNY